MRFLATCTLIGSGLLAALAGCGARGAASPEPLHTPSRSSRTFLDQLDRLVELPAVPQRVISLSPETTELLYAIGAGNRLVGVTDYCNYPKAAAQLPKVGGGTLETLSLEAIVELQPDLVLCKWDSHQPLIDRLEQVRIKAFAVGPANLAMLYDEADQLGRMLDGHGRATRWIAEMKGRIQTLQERVATRKNAKRLTVFYQVWHEPLMSVNDASFIGEVLRMAGLANVFADLAAPFPTVSSEAVVQFNPDIILAPNTDDNVVAQIRSRPGWAPINAVRQNRVYLINPDTISRCGPRLADALEEIVGRVYGDEDLHVGDEAGAVGTGEVR